MRIGCPPSPIGASQLPDACPREPDTCPARRISHRWHKIHFLNVINSLPKGAPTGIGLALYLLRCKGNSHDPRCLNHGPTDRLSPAEAAAQVDAGGNRHRAGGVGPPARSVDQTLGSLGNLGPAKPDPARNGGARRPRARGRGRRARCRSLPSDGVQPGAGHRHHRHRRRGGCREGPHPGAGREPGAWEPSRSGARNPRGNHL